MPEEVDDWNDEYAQSSVVNYTFNTQSVLICWQLASTYSLFAVYVPTPRKASDSVQLGSLCKFIIA